MAIRELVCCLAFTFTGAIATDAKAQSSALPPSALPQNGGAGLRSGAITSTGATVPNPRAITTSPRSAVDHKIGNRDAGRTDYGICKGC